MEEAILYDRISNVTKKSFYLYCLRFKTIPLTDAIIEFFTEDRLLEYLKYSVKRFINADEEDEGLRWIIKSNEEKIGKNQWYDTVQCTIYKRFLRFACIFDEGRTKDVFLWKYNRENKYIDLFNKWMKIDEAEVEPEEILKEVTINRQHIKQEFMQESLHLYWKKLRYLHDYEFIEDIDERLDDHDSYIKYIDSVFLYVKDFPLSDE